MTSFFVLTVGHGAGWPFSLGQRLRGGGKTYRVNLGGGNVPQGVLSKTTFGGLKKLGFGLVGASFF